jgi:hypothetical protein
VKDEDILAGFASLHRAMADGFDRLAREIAGLEHQILDVRNDVARLETRMLRGFDDVDARFDRLERRVMVLEERIA